MKKKTTTEEKRRNPRAQPTAEKKQWQCDERKKVETTWKPEWKPEWTKREEKMRAR